MPFDGRTYDRNRDRARLNSQLLTVRHAMLNPAGKWWKLADLARQLNFPEGSVSARIRDLRKVKFGRWQVESRRTPSGGTWEYRVVVTPITQPGKQADLF